MDHWPLRHLVLRTPRLELRPDDDEGLLELVEEAYLGIHPPGEMPFLVPGGKPTTADLVRHMAHAVYVCGEDHVAIGTDGGLSKTIIGDKARAAQRKFFEDRTARGIAAPGEGPDIFNIVAELDSPARFRDLAAALDRAGWSAARIDKVLGGNLLRLYGEAWGG